MKRRQQIPSSNLRKKISDSQKKLLEAISLHQKNKFAEAREIYDSILKNEPNNFEALQLIAAINLQDKKYLLATIQLKNALKVEKKHAYIYNNLGIGLKGLQKYEEAIVNFDEAINIDKDYIDAFFNLGNTYLDLKNPEKAIVNYKKVIELNPDHIHALNNLGNCFVATKKLDLALTHYQNALTIDPSFIPVYANCGDVYGEMQEFKKSIDCYVKAIEGGYQSPQVFTKLGASYASLNLLDLALQSYQSALAIDPRFGNAIVNSGCALLDKKLHNLAHNAFSKALLSEGVYPYLRGLFQINQMYIAQWNDFESQVSLILSDINANINCIRPFDFLALIDSPDGALKAAKMLVNDKYPNKEYVLDPINTNRPNKKIKIAYFSPDFLNHAGATLIAELIELHDRSKFEIYGFSFSADASDVYSKRLRASFDKFIDVSSLNDIEVANLSRSLNIDIAIDRNTHTKNNRLNIFSYRAAPIQVNFLGYPGTSGTDYIDYIIADHHVIPENNRVFFSEKIAYLQNSYQPNDRKKTISAKNFSRIDCNLPEHAFVYCCFNNIYKITPLTFKVWMSILSSTQGSVLWLLHESDLASENLKKEATICGVEPSRLIFAPKIEHPEHLARQKLADLFLDTLPYNAHTTASDALWVGLPILTCAGNSFQSRVACSLLMSIGAPELITYNYDEYISLAIELAKSPTKLNAIKDLISQNKFTSPLFDSESYTKNLEELFIEMVARNVGNLDLDHII